MIVEVLHAMRYIGLSTCLLAFSLLVLYNADCRVRALAKSIRP